MTESISADVDRVERTLAERYRQVRKFSEQIVESLAAEDCVIQSMPDVSPQRWHLAHTTWFFETFVLAKTYGYQSFDEAYEYLFNSYYNSIGEQFPRAQRGLLSRPTVAEVLEYRRHVDDGIVEMLRQPVAADTETLLEVGLQHEQQHQELMLTDIKHVLSCNPLFPVFRENRAGGRTAPPQPGWVDFEEGIREIGHTGQGFAFDNESPRHRVLLENFQLAHRLVTCSEFSEFIEDGGYQRPEFWLSLGWHTVCQQQWTAPLYWHRRDGHWHQFTLAGSQPLDADSPVCHVSYFEADAYARWKGGRLATEAEWETAAEGLPTPVNGAEQLMADDVTIHPRATATPAQSPNQMFGQVWQWTASPYVAYPGYQAPSGAIGEYNGKFMCNQFVLRGGSVATPANHLRITYRNFFPPDARWQFSGIRLARSPHR